MFRDWVKGQRMKTLLRCFLVFLSLIASQLSFARGYAPAMTPSPTGVAVATVANAQAAAVLSRVGANVNTTSSIIANIANGVTVEAVVTGAITGAASAGAWGAAIGVAGAVAIAAIPAIKGWMDRAGVGIRPDGTLGKPDPNACTTAPCYTFGGYGHAGQSIAEFCSRGNSGTATSGAYALARSTPSGAASCTRVVTWYNCTSADCVNSSDTYDASGFIDGSTSPVNAPTVPATMTEVTALMVATPPTTAEVQALVDANFPPVVAPVSVAGPAATNPTNVVKMFADGSQQIEACKYLLEYFPSGISAHPQCTTTTNTPAKTETKSVTTTNADGTTSTQQVATTTPASSTTATTTGDKVEPKDSPAQDTALGAVPKLYTPKYPLGLVGVWADKKDALKATSLGSLAPKLMPTVADGGSCPTMPVNLTFSHWADFGTHDVAPPCYVWDWGKVIILISALLLARGLIFGG